MKFKLKFAVPALMILLLAPTMFFNRSSAFAMPFYDLKPREIVLRGEFFTTYASSPAERKHNIELSVRTLDGALVAMGEEFSFNGRVGPRTEQNGYKNAKIIARGEFADGVGGGVCQVSSTLYNALLVSGLPVTECHQHTLQVGYVNPSFDAMVNYYYADLKFVNNTHNPIIVRAKADGSTIRISIWGEAADRRYVRKSVITETLEEEEEIHVDETGEYPDLRRGERRVLRYGRAGIKSEGYIYEYDFQGRLLAAHKIREDKYAGIKTVIVIGTADLPEDDDSGIMPLPSESSPESADGSTLAEDRDEGGAFDIANIETYDEEPPTVLPFPRPPKIILPPGPPGNIMPLGRAF